MKTNEKELLSAGTPKSSVKNLPSTVYHIIKTTKGCNTMIELKIIANSAEEITAEVLELAKQVSGTKVQPVVKEEAPAPVEEPQTVGADVVEKVKAAIKHADKKAAFKAWLDANGYERLTVVPAERGAEVLAALGIE